MGVLAHTVCGKSVERRVRGVGWRLVGAPDGGSAVVVAVPRARGHLRLGRAFRLVPAGCVLVVLLALVAAAAGGGLGGGSRGLAARAAGSRGTGWQSVPLAARGPVSAGLGAVEPGYRVHRAGGGLLAVNGAQRLRARFAPGAVAVSSGGGWFGLRLVGVGLGGSLRTVGSVVPVARGNRVSYVRPGVREWYANGPLGLEQGFTVARPAGNRGGVLRLSMALSGDLRASLSGGARGLLFARAGRTVVAYRDLVAADARGRALPAWLELGRGRVEIRVAVTGAAFPVRIDPLAQQAKLTASDGATNNWLGSSVAVSADGSTVVAGAPGPYSSSGGYSTTAVRGRCTCSSSARPDGPRATRRRS